MDCIILYGASVILSHPFRPMQQEKKKVIINALASRYLLQSYSIVSQGAHFKLSIPPVEKASLFFLLFTIICSMCGAK